MFVRSGAVEGQALVFGEFKRDFFVSAYTLINTKRLDSREFVELLFESVRLHSYTAQFGSRSAGKR